MEDLNSITDFRSLARVHEIDKQVYDFALECNLNEDKLARLLFETYSDQVLERLDMLVSSCDKPGDTAATNETDEDASTQESMKKKKQEILNFYGFVEDSELKQLVSNATVNNDGTENDIAKTIYGIILYKTSVNNMDDKNIKTWSITDAYPSKLLYHVHIILHHDPGPQQTTQNSRTREYRNVIECILFMEITRAAKLVISNTDENQPFSITNSVCNQTPNAYRQYTLDSFVEKIDKETKSHLFYDPILKVFKDYLDKHVSTPMPGQEQHPFVIDIESEDSNSGLTSQLASPREPIIFKKNSNLYFRNYIHSGTTTKSQFGKSTMTHSKSIQETYQVCKMLV
jgi:hypothetical protein